MQNVVQSENKKSSRAKIQAFGGFLTNMVIPNIGAFIAWGLLTALFIPTGWIPNETMGQLVDPTIHYLLPILLAFSGGEMISGKRGAVLGALGTIGLIIGAGIPMFLGAMIVGPLGGFIMKKTDKFLEGKIPAGFEMVVNNFTIGIFGFIFMCLSYLFIGPVIESANSFVTVAIEALVSTGFLPLLSLVNEPAKVLFLNNVIDQGIYYPLGMQQTLEAGRSIYFMVASNPGPGLGLLLGFTFFGRKTAKRTAPGAIIIHFLGGIHELYFPYVFMKPLTIIAMILGGASGTLVFQILDVGLVAGPSPGSIFSYLALTPRGNYIGVILGVLVATIVSFLVTSVILKADKKNYDDEESLNESLEKTKKMKSEGSLNSTNMGSSDRMDYSKIIFTCDAGMGSSAMGASVFRKNLKDNGIDNIEVKHYRIEEVPDDSDIIIVHQKLADRVRLKNHKAKIIEIESYLQDEKIDELLMRIKNSNK